MVVMMMMIGCLAGLAPSSQAAAGSFEAGFSVSTANGYRISVAGWRHAIRILVTQGSIRSGRHVVETEYLWPRHCLACGDGRRFRQPWRDLDAVQSFGEEAGDDIAETLLPSQGLSPTGDVQRQLPLSR